MPQVKAEGAAYTEEDTMEHTSEAGGGGGDASAQSAHMNSANSVISANILGTAAVGAGNSIEDYELPRSILQRVIKKAIPTSAKIHKDARSALSRCCTVFINYLTATANDITKKAGRKAVGIADIYKALEILDLHEVLTQRFISNRPKDRRQEYKKRLLTQKQGEEDPDADEEDADRNVDGNAADIELDGGNVAEEGDDDDDDGENDVENDAENGTDDGAQLKRKAFGATDEEGIATEDINHELKKTRVTPFDPASMDEDEGEGEDRQGRSSSIEDEVAESHLSDNDTFE
ncbi:hypothetical protein BASA62_003467 [Batrachochytrium salamandrivorans]|nr:hypothetical protein BASA62_003467 [Batrachochytrium salamandrivorans]